MAWSAYDSSASQVERIRAYRRGEPDGQLVLRFWWAFITVQYLELSGLFIHHDRHHFLTSVLRMVARYHSNERPSASYVRYVMRALDRLWALETGRLVRGII